jgi:hypothetical protein
VEIRVLEIRKLGFSFLLFLIVAMEGKIPYREKRDCLVCVGDQNMLEELQFWFVCVSV